MSRQHLAAFWDREDGQNIVEFALLLPVLLYLLLGIIQFGFIFAAYITLNNAAREGARWGSIYIYDNNLSGVVKTANDRARNDGIVDRIVQSRGILSMAPRGSSTANFSTNSNGSLAVASCPELVPYPIAGYYYGNATNPDVTICYSLPTSGTVIDTEARRGQYLDVQTWYHLQVFIPLFDRFLPNDPVKGPQWIRLPARITVVVN